MRPYLLINPDSGGGRTQESIVAVAEERDLAHHVTTPGEDFRRPLATALDNGADALVAVGGDGTICAVAEVAMENDLPLVVVPAGTRNHFALDLGLDLEQPAASLVACLDAGHERRVDVGTVNGSVFLNNVSLGMYPAAVGTAGYREHKTRAFVEAAAEAASAERGATARLSLDLPGTCVAHHTEATEVVLVVNNAYAPTFAPGARIRPRLDAGEVWVYVGGGVDVGHSLVSTVAHTVHAVFTQQILHAAYGAERLVIRADRDDIPVAVDGEVRHDLHTPLEFVSSPGALRVIVPQDPSLRPVDFVLTW